MTMDEKTKIQLPVKRVWSNSGLEQRLTIEDTDQDGTISEKDKVTLKNSCGRVLWEKNFRDAYDRTALKESLQYFGIESSPLNLRYRSLQNYIDAIASMDVEAVKARLGKKEDIYLIAEAEETALKEGKDSGLNLSQETIRKTVARRVDTISGGFYHRDIMDEALGHFSWSPPVSCHPQEPLPTSQLSSTERIVFGGLLLGLALILNEVGK